MYVFGGHNGINHINDMQVLHTTTRQWRNIRFKGHQPSARSKHSAVQLGRRIYVFGGVNDFGFHQDLSAYEIDSEHWVQPAVKGMPPSARAGHGSAAIGNQMVIFGGEGARDTYFNDTYLFNADQSSRGWTKLHVSGAIPEGRANAGVVTVNSFLFVYGGVHGATYMNDLHMLNVADSMWYRLDTDESFPRQICSMAATVVDRRMFLIGGKDSAQTYNYVFALETDSCAQSATPRSHHSDAVGESDMELTPLSDAANSLSAQGTPAQHRSSQRTPGSFQKTPQSGRTPVQLHLPQSSTPPSSARHTHFQESQELRAKLSTEREQRQGMELSKRQLEDALRTEIARRQKAESELAVMRAEVEEAINARGRLDSDKQGLVRDLEFEKAHSRHLEDSIQRMQDQLAKSTRERGDLERSLKTATTKLTMSQEIEPTFIEPDMALKLIQRDERIQMLESKIQSLQRGISQRVDQERMGSSGSLDENEVRQLQSALRQKDEDLQLYTAQLEALKKSASEQIVSLRRQLNSGVSGDAAALLAAAEEEKARLRAKVRRHVDEAVELRLKLRALAAVRLQEMDNFANQSDEL
eukprot:TRINITY_DN803_c0_g1_i1.p1 TRINITY_DN803_c0_g1~~TRINITY_DN803_c0_g1_i1.p1  ORF type:complete len:685 (-),score=140.29 TRINITY_DN803_c0_g1_i1:1759-3507(-)